jgi:predicted metal-dependent hydrolase
MTAMRALLQYTLDLFEPAGLVDPAQTAPENIAQVVFKHPHADRQMRLGHALVGYRFQRARRRTIGFVIGPDGLVVRAPRWTPLYEVEAALREKSDWIVRKLVETRERHVRQQGLHITWQDGAELPYLGGKLRLALDPEHAFPGVGAQLDEAPIGNDSPTLRGLRIALPTSASASQIRDAVQAWLVGQARDNFHQRLDHFAPLLQVQWRKLSLSNAATRWGSARHDGSIRLNWRLIHFRQDVIDYVVAHELSHLRVMNHSPRFWDTVRTVVPEYAALRSQLKDDAIPRW